MKSSIITVLLALIASAWGLSIYDIQRPGNPGVDNSYPSTYIGKTVSVEGIVTASNYRNEGFCISESVSGPWRGILVLDRSNHVNIGDKVQIRGTVSEIFGMTCIQDLTQLNITDRNRQLPVPVNVTTGQLMRADEAEAYEGVLVRVLNVTCTQILGSRGRFGVTDGTGQCFVNANRFTDRSSYLSPKSGDLFSVITGVVIYSMGEYSINPRHQNDAVTMLPTFNQNRSWGRIKSIYK